MENQKVTPLWEPEENFPSVRKPSSVAKQENIANSSNVSNLDIVKKSTLSVDAKEFFPANFNVVSSSTSAPSKSIQDRLKKYKPIENNYSESSSRNEFDFLYNSLELLTVKPGKFDNVVPDLIEHLEPYFNDVESVSKITEVLFNQVFTFSIHI